MSTKKGPETLKRHKKSVSSNGAFRTTLRAEKETPSSGTRDRLFLKEHKKVDEASRKLEKKPWNRLDRGHRIRKIKEWVDDLSGEQYTDTLKDEMRTVLVKAIQKKEITTNTCVEYDTETCKVISVPSLMLIDNTSEEDDCTNTRVIIRKPDTQTKRRKKKKTTQT
jgi:hypothetical protein